MSFKDDDDKIMKATNSLFTNFREICLFDELPESKNENDDDDNLDLPT